MLRYLRLFSIFSLLLVSLPALAQPDAEEEEMLDGLVQFSGVVVAGDNLQPIPFTNIIIRNTRRGTISDVYGFFSFVARESDTIVFSSVGFKKAEFVIPDSLGDNRYSLIQMMQNDTILLRETVIYPWPSKEDFRDAFLALQLPTDDMERARFNLEQKYLRELSDNMAMDGTENYRFAMQQQQAQLYYAGQAPPINILNPVAWSQFIKSWRNGDFKRKKDDD